MIALVRIALSRPYTFVVLALLILILGPLAALRTPVDIFPDIRIPVISVVWQYTGLPPDDMSGRITTPFQRALTTTVNDIEHIEANSYTGIGIIKIFFQPYADIRTANAQVTAISQTLIKAMPPGATPPLILNYNASTVPILFVALSGRRVHRAAPRRHRHQSGAHAAGDGAGRGHCLAVRRQAAPDPDRPRSGRVAGPRPVRPGRRQRARRAEPDHADRHPEDRRASNMRSSSTTRRRGSPTSPTCRSRPSTARWSTCATSLRCATATRRRPTSSTSTATARCCCRC